MKKKYPWAETFFNGVTSPEQKRIVERLKEYTKFTAVYDEIEKRVDDNKYPEGRACVLFDIIKAAVACENKGEIKEGPGGLKKLNDLQKKIAKQSEALASLLDERDRLINPQYKTSKATVAPIDIYMKAGLNMRTERRIDFKRNTMSSLEAFYKSRYDLTQPTLQEMLRELTRQMEDNPVLPTHPGIKKMLDFRKNAPAADFVRYFLHSLNISIIVDLLPRDFFLTASTVAIITGAAMDIDGGVTNRAVELAARRPKKRATIRD